MGLVIDTDENNWGFKGKNYLFTIGIDKYKFWTPLKSAVKDVRDFEDLLTSRYQFEKSDVFTLTDESATENNIINKFIELSESKITSEDNLVVYFSGHGHIKAKTGYWIPVDAPADQPAQFINNAVIADWLRNINSLHTFLIVDACFSGTLTSQLRSGSRSEKFKSRRVFTSGRAEVVPDGRVGENSPFAKGLLLTLRQNTQPFIFVSRLITDVKEYLSREAKQEPMDASIVNAEDEGGEFLFHLKISEEEVWATVVKLHGKDVYQKFIDDFSKSPHVSEARDALDWLTAEGANTIQTLTAYIIDHVGDGKFLEQAKERLDEVTWLDAKKVNTLLSLAEYVRQFPNGKFVVEAKQAMTMLAKKLSPGSKEIEEAKERALLPPDPAMANTVNPSESWEKANATNTFLSLLDFIQRFPTSEHVPEARSIMKRLDKFATNKIMLAVSSKDLSCNEKIQMCIDYFRDYPGAENNDIIKKLKNRLLMERYTTSDC
ncbi:MAG TPA: caspase family protein [Chryseolinea sp.]|nr:caspase family protein [Chryseolinea sp.]